MSSRDLPLALDFDDVAAGLLLVPDALLLLDGEGSVDGEELPALLVALPSTRSMA